MEMYKKDLKIDGMSKDEEIVTNEIGGKQSKLNYRFDLIDPQANFKLANVLHKGAEKYKEWNWLNIPCKSHLNHALSHIYAYLAGDNQDDHLDHAFCRLMMAVRKSIDEKPSNTKEELRNISIRINQ